MSDQMVSLVRCTRCATSLAWSVDHKTWCSMTTGKTTCPQGGPHVVFTPKLEAAPEDFVAAVEETPVQDEPAVTYAPDMETLAVTLNAQDRCDRCGAQALHRAERETFELLFCNHHFEENSEKLTADGWIFSR